MSQEKPNIFNYLNYRLYLADFIAFLKTENSSFSMRAFAAKMQCNPGFFNRILKGERNLTAAHAIDLLTICKLSKKEYRYFETLVAYNHAKKQSERDRAFETLLQYKKTNTALVSGDQFHLYSHWYNLAIREMLAIIPRFPSLDLYAKEIAKNLDPRITTGEARDALEQLVRCDIIIREEDGSLRVSDNFTASGTTLPQVLVNRFLLECIDLARRAVDGIPKERRRLSTLTFSSSKAGFEKISNRIDEFRQELLGMIAGDDAPLDRVCHLNLQLFPVTNRILTEDTTS